MFSRDIIGDGYLQLGVVMALIVYGANDANDASDANDAMEANDSGWNGRESDERRPNR